MSDYQDCMTKAMREFPQGITKEERGRLFCIQAKLCSGKAKDKAQAEQLCLESSGSPATPKKGKIKKKSPNCGQQMAVLAGCAVKKIDFKSEDLALQLAQALKECACE